MPHRAFALFILPSLLAMLVFIALPLMSVVFQSFHVEHPQVLVQQETCDPFGCKTETRVDTEAMAELNAAAPQGGFNGIGTYLDAAHLAVAEVRAIWAGAAEISTVVAEVLNLPFYRALLFTLIYTVVVSPSSLALGFLIAVSVNILPRAARGGVIYLTLLPMIVPSVIGALTLFWMIDQNGINRGVPAIGHRRRAPVAQGIGRAVLGHAVCPRHLVKRALCVHRGLCRPADRAA